MAEIVKRPITEEADFLQLETVDHIRFWVGNAKQAMYYWWKGFGFAPVAYSGLGCSTLPWQLATSSIR